MKIIDVEQRSEAWLKCRAGIPTASELGQLLTPEFQVRTGDMPKTYIARKVAERWQGFPLPSYSGGAMEQGTMTEDEARKCYENEFGVDVRRVGFITTDDGSFGSSPDGLMDDDSGLEIKCPLAPNHVRWILGEGCPKEHILQCQGGMYVTGAKLWRFVSYCRGFPALVRVVERDEAAMKAIGAALAGFGDRADAAMKRLEEENGGPPRRRPVTVPAEDESDHPF